MEPTPTPVSPVGLVAPAPGTPVTWPDGKPAKRMTAAQMARWEAEQARLQAIAEEEERLRLEEIERAWQMPLIPRLDFDETTRNKEPSISPRDRLSQQSDKRYLKEVERFREKNTNFHKFLIMMHTEILRRKPDNILDFLAEEYFSLANEPALRKEVNRICEE